MNVRRGREKVPGVYPITWSLSVTKFLRTPGKCRVKGWSVLGPSRGALKVTLGGLRQPLAAERGKRPLQPARPFWQMGPRVALARQNLLAGGGGGSPSGFTRPWAGLLAGRVGTPRGRQGAGPVGGGRGFPLSGDLRRAAETRAVPLPSSRLLGGVAFPGARGVGGAGLSLAAGAGAPSPETPQKPLLRCLGLQSSPRPPPSPLRLLLFPAPARAPPPPSSLGLRFALPGFQGGCPGGAVRRGKGEESRPPAQHFQ